MSKNITYNIGYEGFGTSGILSKFPTLLENTSFTEFVKIVRDTQSIDTLWEWATDFRVTTSTMCLFIRIDDGEFYWEYKIKLMNVREYRAKWESKYGPWNMEY